MTEYSLFTSESVSEGHPDKIADQISDAILDAILAEDPRARVACETMVKTGVAIISGEITTSAWVDLESIVRGVINDIGYTSSDVGFDGATCSVINIIGKQSPEINQGVDRQSLEEQGAGDQGLMFGYACTETDVLMPAPIHYSHAILRSLAEARHSGAEPGLGPDSKSQVTLEYVAGKPVRAASVVVSTQHSEDLDQDQVREIVRPHVLSVLPEGWMCEEDEFYVNPTGRFVRGGPDGDAGLTGRKIIVDTYGGSAPHGGGAFSGKDPSKVDRSAAYAGRWVAKNIVAAGLASRCEIQVSYAIGEARPTSISLNTFGTETVPHERIVAALREVFDLRPFAIIRDLDLLHPIYRPTATYGHFGREPEADGGFSWEKTDLVDQLKALA